MRTLDTAGSLVWSLITITMLAGCQASVPRIVVRDDLPSIRGAEVRSLRTSSGRQMSFDRDRAIVREDSLRFISGRTTSGDSVDIPFADVAEADVRVLQNSVGGTWLAAGSSICLAILLVLSQFSAH